MRVLFSSSAFWPVIGGIEVRAARLLPALQKRGYEFIVVTGRNSPDLPMEAEFRGIPVYRFSFGRIDKDIHQFISIRQRIGNLRRSFAPNLVHRNGVGVDSLFCLITAADHPAPLLLTLCNDLGVHSTKQDSLLGRLLRSADWVNSVSAAALAQARRLFPELASRSSAILNGLDKETFVPAEAPSDNIRLLYLGRLVHQKGIDIALTAFASVIRRYPEAKFIIAGDGPKRESLRRQAAELGLTRSVDFRGWISPEQVPALLGSATVVVMPSRWEGLPNVALQAALMARPVVGTPVGGLMEIVEHQKTGLLVGKEDSASLAEAILFLLDNPDIASQLGHAARGKVEQEFSWDRYVDAYDMLYRKLIRDGQRGFTAPTVR